jgi:hypothetical protein
LLSQQFNFKAKLLGAGYRLLAFFFAYRKKEVKENNCFFSFTTGAFLGDASNPFYSRTQTQIKNSRFNLAISGNSS